MATKPLRTTIAQDSNGYALAEMVVYIALLATVFLLVATSVVSFSRSYKELKAVRLVEHSGMNAMERMTRDIRAAESVATAQSTLGSSPGAITVASSATTTRFYLQGQTLAVDVNGTYSGPLTLSNVSIPNLVFRTLTSSTSDAVKIDMTVSATVGQVTRSKTYHSTIILRGS